MTHKFNKPLHYPFISLTGAQAANQNFKSSLYRKRWHCVILLKQWLLIFVLTKSHNILTSSKFSIRWDVGKIVKKLEDGVKFNWKSVNEVVLEQVNVFKYLERVISEDTKMPQRDKERQIAIISRHSMQEKNYTDSGYIKKTKKNDKAVMLGEEKKWTDIERQQNTL